MSRERSGDEGITVLLAEFFFALAGSLFAGYNVLIRSLLLFLLIEGGGVMSKNWKTEGGHAIFKWSFPNHTSCPPPPPFPHKKMTGPFLESPNEFTDLEPHFWV